jgi:integrase
MLFRLVRPVKRFGSSMSQFVQRIPADIRARAIGRSLAIPIGENTRRLIITAQAPSIRFSLRTRDPIETKIRQAKAAGYLETVWRALREVNPTSLSHKQATALAGQLYRAWAEGEEREETTGITWTPQGWIEVRITPEEDAAAFKATVAHLDKIASDGIPAHLERAVGPLVDRLLLARGIATVDSETRPILLDAFILALRDAMQHRERTARGDYSPDPKAQRFPEWKSPDVKSMNPAKATAPMAAPSLTALVDDWWREAKAAGRKPSTHESYGNSVAALVAFLSHDDALRVTPEDILRFKDHRLATINPRTGKTISAKTVKDSDLAGLKTIFGWAVSNLRMPTNPAAGISIKVGKPVKLRSKGFTDAEASAILTAAANLVPSREQPWTFEAKRWVPWLCAYTGARVGELAQLRKQDVRQEGEHWVIRVTPEAGTVKTNEAREIVLHPHIIEQGFADFASSAPAGHLFLKLGKNGNVLGPLQGLKNRLAEFARSIVSDPNVAPNHGWRHRFKTVGMEAGIDHRILDAIQGQAPRSVAETYGDVTVNTMAAAIGKLPCIVVSKC